MLITDAPSVLARLPTAAWSAFAGVDPGEEVLDQQAARWVLVGPVEVIAVTAVEDTPNRLHVIVELTTATANSTTAEITGLTLTVTQGPDGAWRVNAL